MDEDADRPLIERVQQGDKQAFGLLHIDGKRVQPQVVFMNPDGSFIYEGKKWA